MLTSHFSAQVRRCLSRRTWRCTTSSEWDWALVEEGGTVGGWVVIGNGEGRGEDAALRFVEVYARVLMLHTDSRHSP